MLETSAFRNLPALLFASFVLAACAEDSTEREASAMSEPATAADPETVLATDDESRASTSDEIVVYTAKKIVTMDTSLPTATAVAVNGDLIVSVGTLETLKPWLDSHPHRIDTQFEDKVLLPGLIDPHLHPMIAAIQFGTVWIPPETWVLHDATVPAVTTPTDYREILADAIRSAEGDGKPLFLTWGWSEPEHGPMTRDDLDRIAADRPAMIFQRSVHEAVVNTAAIEYMGLDESDTEGYSDTEVNWSDGHFVEAGFFEIVLPRLASYLFSPEFIDPGFARTTDYLVSNGVTTVGDLSTGQVDWNLELGALERNLVDKAAPFRTVLIPAAFALSITQGGLEESFNFVDKELSRNDAPPQLVYGKRIKLFADGAAFSLGGQVEPPGYIDGHEGEWITPKDEFRAQAERYWRAGYRVHVHANGDAGIGFTLGVFEDLQEKLPRRPNALVMEHYGQPNETLNRRVANLNASVSANPYYLRALGDTYANLGVGKDRARNMVPAGSLVDLGVPVALHSDFGMAPANPIYLAWTAMNRTTVGGDVFNPPRGLTRDEAFRAITIDAAYVLGLDDKIGSIQAGKKADFSIFDEDPTTVPFDRLETLNAWGVVFEGEIRQATSSQ